MDGSEAHISLLEAESDETSDSNQPQEGVKPKRHVTGAERRRFLWWTRQGKSIEEAKELALKPYFEIPEYIKIKNVNDDAKNAKKQHKSTNRRNLETDFIRMGIKANTTMSEPQIEILKKCVISCIGGGAYEGEGPHFCGSYSRCGIFIMKCTDEHTINWVTTIFSTLEPWKRAKLTLLNEREIKSEISLFFRRKQSKEAHSS